MADPYWRYAAPADRATIPRPAIPGYPTSEASTLPSRIPWASHDRLSNSSDYLHRDATSSIRNILNERPDPLKADGLADENLFRPFFGFKEIRVVHKEPRHDPIMPLRPNNRCNPPTMDLAAIEAMVDERVAAALANYESQRQQSLDQGGGSGGNPKPCSYKDFLNCKPESFYGDGGVIELTRWFEKTESVFAISSCTADCKVKFAASMFMDAALTWWNGNIQVMSLPIANALTWEELKVMLLEEYCPRSEVQNLEQEFWNLTMKGSEIQAYTTRFTELALLCPEMASPEYKKIERYIWGLAPQIQSLVTASGSTTFVSVKNIAFRLTDQGVRHGTMVQKVELHRRDDNKRKLWGKSKGNQRQAPHKKQETITAYAATTVMAPNQQKQYSGTLPKCNKCNFHHTEPCREMFCAKCKRKGHTARFCKSPAQGPAHGNNTARRACYGCGDTGHFKKDCPKATGGAHDMVFAMGTKEAITDPRCVTGTFLIDNLYATVLFDLGAARSFWFCKILWATLVWLPLCFLLGMSNTRCTFSLASPSVQVSINGSRNCISFLRESIAAMAMQAGMGFSRIVILVGAGYSGTLLIKNGKLSDVLGELQGLVKGYEGKEGDGAEGDYSGAIASQVRRLAMEVRQLAVLLVAKRHLTQRIENLDGKLDDQMTNVRGDVSQIEYDLDSLNKMISGLNGKIMILEEKQDMTNLGVWYLCNMADGNKLSGTAKEQFKLAGKSFGGHSDGFLSIDGVKEIVETLDPEKESRMLTRRHSVKRQTMADPYWRYAAPADRATIPRPAIPGYPTSEASTLPSRIPWASHDRRSNSSDYLHRDNLVSRPGEYVPDSVYSGYSTGASLNGYSYSSTLVDQYLPGRREATSSIPNILNERPDPLKADGIADEIMQSNVLFVDGLPNDCSRREVSHLFRPFFGFKEIRVVHKEPRHKEDKAMVLCFVEFADAKCALSALEALQGYKFDNKKPESPVLKIHFAHFPFQLPSNKDAIPH
ncbi:hypothetical protein LXL04_028557 [Taraxacum kok-saghyz]